MEDVEIRKPCMRFNVPMLTKLTSVGRTLWDQMPTEEKSLI